MNQFMPLLPAEDRFGVEQSGALQLASAGKHKTRASLGVLLVVADTIALLGGFAIATLLRYGYGWSRQPDQWPILLSLIPIYLLCAVACRAYSGSCFVKLSETIRRALIALLAATGLMLFVIVALQVGEKISRLHLGLEVASTAMLLVALRTWHCSHARRRLGGSLYSVLVLHDDEFQPSADAPGSIAIRGIFDPAQADAAAYDRLGEILSRADRVIIRCAPQRRELWAHIMRGMNVHAEVIAPELHQTGVLGIGRFDGRPTLILAKGPLNLQDRVLKRGFDIAVSLTALTLLFPLMLFTAIAIKLETRGPVFFRQQRIGRQNKLFDIYKFRSMRQDECDEDGALSTARGDTRITRVGHFIRKTSIDELPQLLNVLRGEMSIVGPRPHAVYSTVRTKLFWEVDERYWHRHACKPGITGLAQIRGYRGTTHTEGDLANRLQSDLEYLGKWSLWHDLAIIMRTVLVLIHRNAY